MKVSEAQEVKALREENARLKKLVANLSLRRVSTTLRHSGTEISEYFRLS